MRIFHKKDGGIVQLVGKDAIKEWPVELPLIFIEYIRKNKLGSYNDKKVEKEIEKYLDEILTEVAIPGMISVLDGEDETEIKIVLERIDELAKKKLDLVKPIKAYIEKLDKKSNKKDISKACGSILSTFVKEENKKKLADKRKKMRQIEQEFLQGKISGEEYAKSRKEYLIMKE
ncbi:MAG: hypothetical protein ACTSP9_02805 [Promethearchaeota archaeon]